MRLVSFDDGSGPQAGILLDGEIVPASALKAPASSVRGLLATLDADGLADLCVQASRARRADRACRRAAAGSRAGPGEDHLPGPELP